MPNFAKASKLWKKLKYSILYPFALLYDLITRVRNHLFDIGYKREFEFDTRVVAVGNLTVGGTGKSPMVEHLIRLLKDRYKVVTLSRGYGRQTKGFRIAEKTDNAYTLGDEPYQFYTKFPDIHVTVGEERAVAIPYILAELPETKVILLDDAYQHRTVKPNVNILLTDFNRPFYKDHVLPWGRLREARKGAKRADAIVVTKCPETITSEEMAQVTTAVKKYNSHAPIAFSTVSYLPPQPIFEGALSLTFAENVLLFSGIANPTPLVTYVSEQWTLTEVVHFKDHHRYRDQDITALVAKYEAIPGDNKCILTTEKDRVKLLHPDIQPFIAHLPIFYLPIEVSFVKGGSVIDDLVLNSI